MIRRFAALKVKDKLQALRTFARAARVRFEWRGQAFAFPEAAGPQPADTGPASDTPANAGITQRAVTPGGAVLTLTGLEAPLDDSLLAFLARGIEDDLYFTGMTDLLFEASGAIVANLSLDPLLHRILELLEKILKPEGTSIMLVDPVKKALFWEVCRGATSGHFNPRVELPLDKGIAGYVASTGEPVLVNDVAADSRWCAAFDQRSGFRTRSLLCMPIRFRDRILGVVEVINKQDTEFGQADLDILDILAAPMGAAIANAQFYARLERAYEDLKSLDRARGKVMNHLSHELRTPLALIASTLEMVNRRLEPKALARLEKALARGRRNVKRLQDLQAKLDDILNGKPLEQKTNMLGLIEGAAGLLEEAAEEARGAEKAVLERMGRRLEAIYRLEGSHAAVIPLPSFLEELAAEARSAMAARGRAVRIDLVPVPDCSLVMDPAVLGKVCRGLLKNAVENTPDEGRVEIRAERQGHSLKIIFKDDGVGISEENQKNIFGGFFHTQDTNYYASKEPYDFDAGGAGADLLRTKVFSERLGFFVNFTSQPCPFHGEGETRCPGRISRCGRIAAPEECALRGGSTFELVFPAKFLPPENTGPRTEPEKP